MKQRADFLHRIGYARRCFAVDQSGQLEVMVILKEKPQSACVDGFIIGTAVHRHLTAIKRNEINEAMPEDSIVDTQHLVSLFNEGCTGGFEAQNSFSILNHHFSFRVIEVLEHLLHTMYPLKEFILKIRIQYRHSHGSSYSFRDKGGPRGHSQDISHVFNSICMILSGTERALREGLLHSSSESIVAIQKAFHKSDDFP